MKKLLFVSHIHSERTFAAYLGEVFKNHYRASFDIFISSSHELGVQSGTDLHSVVLEKLQHAEMILVCCCPESINKPWINFEAGAGVARGIPVVPLCYGGLEFTDLPTTLSYLSGNNMSNKEDIERLNKHIADTFGLYYIPLDQHYREELIKNSVLNSEKNEVYKSNLGIVKEIIRDGFLKYKHIIKELFFREDRELTLDEVGRVYRKKMQIEPYSILRIIDHNEYTNICPFDFMVDQSQSHLILRVLDKLLNNIASELELAIGMIKDSNYNFARELVILRRGINAIRDIIALSLDIFSTNNKDLEFLQTFDESKISINGTELVYPGYRLNNMQSQIIDCAISLHKSFIKLTYRLMWLEQILDSRIPADN